MKEAALGPLDERILVLAPTAKDAELAQTVFSQAGLDSFCCAQVREVSAELERGAAAVLLAEEAVDEGEDQELVHRLAAQPRWSDLPVLVLARRGADSAAVAQAVDRLGNVTVLERPVRQLSKGMTQKLGLAAAFLLERDLYVLDEPMSGLDPAARVAVKSVLRRLAAEGRTLFFTSHVLADVEELCSSLAVLEAGAVRFRGTAVDLCRRYGEERLEQAFMRCVRGK